MDDVAVPIRRFGLVRLAGRGVDLECLSSSGRGEGVFLGVFFEVLHDTDLLSETELQAVGAVAGTLSIETCLDTEEVAGREA